MADRMAISSDQFDASLTASPAVKRAPPPNPRSRSRRPRRASILGVLGALALLLGIVAPALAATVIDMTTAGASATHNGAVFQQGPLPSSAGTGVIDPFIRIGANLDEVQGY